MVKKQTSYINLKSVTILMSILISIAIIYFYKDSFITNVNLAQVDITPTTEPSPQIIPTLLPSPSPIPTPIPSPSLKPSVSPKPSPIPVPVNNAPPGAGYSRQTVSSSKGNFVVDIIAADLGSTKVIVDTASSSNCGNECPVMSLSAYASRNGAFAGINGAYFCPASYSQCAGKTNSFDTLLMNKDKTYFNSDNNVYSSIPAVIFSSGSVRFIGSSSEWGRDTGIDSMIANYPLLIQNNTNNFGGSSDPKHTSRGPRSFVANRGSTIYIGFVNNATLDEEATVLQTMGVENALHLDDGGSTALWFGGYSAGASSSAYKKGPGRELPNAILFLKR